MTPPHEALTRLRITADRCEDVARRTAREGYFDPPMTEEEVVASAQMHVELSDARALLSLLDRTREVLRPPVKAWNETGVSLPPNYPEGQLADLARRGLQPEFFRSAASLYADLTPDGQG